LMKYMAMGGEQNWGASYATGQLIFIFFSSTPFYYLFALAAHNFVGQEKYFFILKIVNESPLFGRSTRLVATSDSWLRHEITHSSMGFH